MTKNNAAWNQVVPALEALHPEKECGFSKYLGKSSLAGDELVMEGGLR